MYVCIALPVCLSVCLSMFYVLYIIIKEKDLYQEPEPVMAGGVAVALQMANRKGE